MFCGLYSYSDILINSYFLNKKERKTNIIKIIKNRNKNLGSAAVKKKI